MIASVGCSIVGSGRSSTRMSPGAWSTAPRMGVVPLLLGYAGRLRRRVEAAPRWHAAVDASVAAEDLLGHAHRGEGLRPAGVEGEVGDRLDQLLLGHPVVLRELQVEGQLLGIAA